MEIFEIHITADKSILNNELGLKSIAIDLLKPDGTTLRTEYMTSQVARFSNYILCKEYVDDIVRLIPNVIRVKIECPYYNHYIDQSCYVESHFLSDDFKFPTSRNQRKTELLATDRTYDKSEYQMFTEKYKDVIIELCLFDSYHTEDKDWFNYYATCQDCN